MHDAATWSTRWRGSSETAAVATAAHDVLSHYVPTAAADLGVRLAETLADVPDGDAEDRGARIGALVAAQLIKDRARDGYGDTRIRGFGQSYLSGAGCWEQGGQLSVLPVPTCNRAYE